ncbi:MAG: aminotransferase class I/II-fold pyridoxal phosphate-dependent enzyme [Pseudomonadota bacterium]
MSDSDKRPKHHQTLAAQALGRIDPTTKAVVPPLHLSTTYLRDPDGGYRTGRGYTRAENPTYDTAEDLLTTLEGGAASLLFASGMAAAVSVFQTLLPGDHVVAPKVMYWALRKWLNEFAVAWGLVVDFVDTTEVDAVSNAIRTGQTRVVWLETPANPTWELSDIRRIAELTHQAGARLVVDSTVATPVLTRPLELGADLVVHSATKYLNGHSDVLAGAVVTRERDPFWHRLKTWQHDGGAVLGPFEAWLLLRGMRTLFVRVERASQSALAIAQHFEAHPEVVEVLYPGLASHPHHALAKTQMTGGFGGMLSLRVKGGERRAIAAAARVETFARATSLGGVESLIEHRASIEGPSTPVPADLLRLSIGLEHVDDLIADLEQALGGTGGDYDNVDLTQPPSDDPIDTFILQAVRPVILDRGGDVVSVIRRDSAIVLRVNGSPGAYFPMRADIEEQVRAIDATVTAVHFEASGERRDVSADRNDYQRFVDEAINPSLAAHGGRIAAIDVQANVARVSLGGRCQGCTLAEVTLRQGIEPMLRERWPTLTAVIDVTDHERGLDPFYKPGKTGGPAN